MLLDGAGCWNSWQDLQEVATCDWFISQDWCISFEFTRKQKWAAADVACFIIASISQILSDIETHERHLALSASGRLGKGKGTASTNQTWCNERDLVAKFSRFGKEVLMRSKKQQKNLFSHIDFRNFVASMEVGSYYGVDGLSEGCTVLEVGCGNFSFAEAVCDSLQKEQKEGQKSVTYVASSKESFACLQHKYGESEMATADDNEKYQCLYNIDLSCPTSCSTKLLEAYPDGFSSVLFLNPHAGDERERNVHLLEHFFEVCDRVLSRDNPRASVQLTLAKPDVHYQQWNVSAVAARANFRRVSSKPLFLAKFPKYQPVYGDKRDEKTQMGLLAGGKHGGKIYFTCNPITYIFERRPLIPPI
ncbi:unnamed protein product [Amoebophrya sp. A25]|nr:unnamed protein product [Amoebophrya sp. A25]|eukprot:GSA25T00014278001.1